MNVHPDLAHVQGAHKRILIACIGNIFLGDDGFGVEVARRLLQRGSAYYPKGVQVVDFGIRGIELAYALLDERDVLVLVDAVPRGGTPGTLYLIEPDLTALDMQKGAEAERIALDAHSMDPLKVLAFARTLGAKPISTLLVGCEPAVPVNDGYAEMQIGLSQPVEAAIEKAVNMIDELVADLCSSNQQKSNQAT
jgi:hydrogenase maturation protease